MTSGKKVGRPKLTDPIKHQLTVRLKEETMKKLDEYSDKHDMTKGEAVRLSVEKLLEDK